MRRPFTSFRATEAVVSDVSLVSAKPVAISESV
jgi:hypothetical protein